jgi:predicted nucleotidyltransferase
VTGAVARSDRISWLLWAIAREGTSVNPAGSLTVTVFGSALDQPSQAKDVDLWVTGDETSVASFRVRACRLGRIAGIPVDLSTEIDLPSPLASAGQWQASHGLALIGTTPEEPSMDAHEVDSIYQTAALARARNALDRADLLARLDLSSAAEYSEYAARWLLRSRLTHDRQWRTPGALTADALSRALAPVAPALSGTVAKHGWASWHAVHELDALYAVLWMEASPATRPPSTERIELLK